MSTSLQTACHTDLRQPGRETRRRQFMEFIYRADDLDFAVDLLVYCAKPRSWTELVRHGRDCGADHVRTLTVLNFLTSQGLFNRFDGRHEASPQAIDELTRRIENNGAASPARPIVDPYPAARRQAMQKVAAALVAAGYHDKSNRRLRAVK